MPSPNPQIPIINISPTNPCAATQLLAAATTHGFVFIENNAATGISQASIDRMFALSKRFFASPVEVKEEVAIASNHAGKNHGWLRRGVEKLDPGGEAGREGQVRSDVKEAFNMGEPINNNFQQPLPSPLLPHKETLLSFQRSCHALCSRLLSLFAAALDLADEDWLTARHDPSKGPTGTVFRLLYYPRVEDYEDGVDIRAGAHSDYGSVTLLFQERGGAPGLEIQGAADGGEWVGVPVDPREGSEGEGSDVPILVNIGDLLEDWTGGLLKSTVHRVVFPKSPAATTSSSSSFSDSGLRDRYSIAYFCHPLDDARLEPVPSKMVQAHAAKTGKGTRRRTGEVLTAKDHLMERLGRSYSVK